MLSERSNFETALQFAIGRMTYAVSGWDGATDSPVH